MACTSSITCAWSPSASASTAPSIPSRWSRVHGEHHPGRGLLVGLRDRGLDLTHPVLAVLNGAKALSATVKEIFDQPVIARCQIYKLRNVRDHLPGKMRGSVTKRMRAAYHADSALQTQARIEALARELDKTHPGAAGSLRKGMAETLTVLRLDLPPTLARTLRSTNAIESMIGICREHAKNVKRWQDGQMALRWCAAGMVEGSSQFRPVNGHLHLSALRAALKGHVGVETVGADCNTQHVSAA
jgi:putative transposase